MHTWYLQLQGEQFSDVAQALRDGDFDAARVTPAERKLLEFVGTLTRHADRITDDQVQGLRDAGLSDAQIAEAVYEGATYNFLVRLADAFDIHPDPKFEPTGIPLAVRPALDD